MHNNHECVPDEAVIFNADVSDHYGQIYERNDKCNSKKHYYRRMFSNEDYKKLYEMRESETWVRVYMVSRVDKQYEIFIAMLTGVLLRL